MQQLPAEGQQAGAASVGEEAEVANADETAREQVQQEAAQELVDGQGHESFLVAVSRVAPAKGDVVALQRDQSVVGNRHAMGVGAEIAQGVLGSAEGTLGIDDPVVTEEGSEPGAEGAWIVQMGEAAVKLEIASLKGRLQPGGELATEDAAEDPDGQKEAAGGGDPSVVVRSQAAGGQDAVDMRVEQQSLIPRVQDAEESDLGSEVPGIACDFQQCLCAGVKQQVEDNLLVLQGQRGDFAWQGEDGMHVARRQQFGFPRLKPAQAGVALTAWAMPVAARNGVHPITCLMGSACLWVARAMKTAHSNVCDAPPLPIRNEVFRLE